jgi:hypothetical protein
MQCLSEDMSYKSIQREMWKLSKCAKVGNVESRLSI